MATSETVAVARTTAATIVLVVFVNMVISVLSVAVRDGGADGHDITEPGPIERDGPHIPESQN